jgi:hypothetical protein
VQLWCYVKKLFRFKIQQQGMQANYGFWVRARLVGVGVGNAASIQIPFWLEVPSLRLKQILTYCLIMGVSYVAKGSSTVGVPDPVFHVHALCTNTACTCE